MKSLRLPGIVTAILLLALPALAADTIKIGFNIELTGDIPKVGEVSKFAAEMLKERDQRQGRPARSATRRTSSNSSTRTTRPRPNRRSPRRSSSSTQDKVLAIIGPNSSKQAIPAGEVADDNQTPMVSPWSTNPDTTKDRPWVFRAAFLDPFQGPVAANFAAEQFKAKTAAVLYDIANDYPKGLAEIFKDEFEKKMRRGLRRGLRDPRHQGPGLQRPADQDRRRQARLHLHPRQLQ